MSGRQASPYDSIARKWLALAERRHASLLEISASGRWRHFLTEPELRDQIDQISLARDRWMRIIGQVPEADKSQEAALSLEDELFQIAMHRRRA